ncbi:hypothetical protein [Clostridium butyricum]|nr:hypothetical protein [Clostridium butyricum]MDU5723317.1 hypothetical protein [Clostridium butyricum]MDU5821378.1 hypothetical protein [Clostridium butyricum]
MGRSEQDIKNICKNAKVKKELAIQGDCIPSNSLYWYRKSVSIS